MIFSTILFVGIFWPPCCRVPPSIEEPCNLNKTIFCINWEYNGFPAEIQNEIKCDEEGRKLLEIACGKGSGDYYCGNDNASKKVLLPVENGCYWNYVYHICSEYGIIVKSRNDCVSIIGKRQ
jgi:hypothetical protein